jgi:group I intron endonuclease
MKETILNLPEKSGIYKITSPNGKVYIGESVNLKNRCKFYLSPNRIKKQRAIYNSLIKYGVDNHIFEIIEFCDVVNLKERERHFQEFYNSVNNGLNCFYSSTTNKLKKHSEETIKIMSMKSSDNKNSFYGKKHTEESLKKISDSSKGVNNPNYGGKFINDEFIKKQINSNSKKPLRVTDIVTGEFFDFINSKECAIFLGVSDSNVRISKTKGWKIKKKFTIQDIK